MKQQIATIHPVKADADAARESLLWVAIDAQLRQVRREMGDESITKPLQTFGFALHLRSGQLAGGSKSDNAWHIQRARPDSSFLPSPLLQGGQPNRGTAAGDIKGPLPLGAIQLVC